MSIIILPCSPTEPLQSYFQRQIPVHMITGLKSHAMLTLPAIAQRSANLGVTIIDNVCHPVPRCPNDRGLSVTCRPGLSVFDPPICYRLGPFDGKSPSASIRVSSPRARQRSVGQQSCTVFAFLFGGLFFFFFFSVTAV